MVECILSTPSLTHGAAKRWLDPVEGRPWDKCSSTLVVLPKNQEGRNSEGLLLYELQQSSDLTYRFYDWDRNDPSRELHIVKSLDVADLEPYANHLIQPVEIQESGATRTFLCACEYFAAELLKVQSGVLEQPAGACFHILTVVQGSGRVRCGAPAGPEVQLTLETRCWCRPASTSTRCRQTKNRS